MKSQLKILVVDDDSDNALSLAELFQMEGHEVRVALSGQEAIDACIHDAFDLAFIDVMMPGKNGVESFIEIRRLRPDARVFMMTGYSVEELLRQAVSEGAMGYIEKPFDPAEVLRLTQGAGRGGLLVALPQTPHGGVGAAIEVTLRSQGLPCQRLSDAAALAGMVPPEQVLIIDVPMPLIDSVSSYKALLHRGWTGATIIVPPDGTAENSSDDLLRDVCVTGVLGKPFDPLDLITRLPQLAA
jgi:CheY-like chemotaxis protein